jgi:hypothetical protein
MECREVKTWIADLLLDPAAVPAEVRAHAVDCADCRTELRELQATMQLLDSWNAPEPSPFFDVKLRGRLRQEREAPPAGWWERTRARLLYDSNLHMRPVAAGALAMLLAVGGGTAYWVEHNPAPAQQSATVRDLQSLDGNAQVFQQLNALDSDEDDGASSTN